MHSAGASPQLKYDYHSVPHTPNYRPSMQHSSPQYQPPPPDPLQINRPLFRSQSTSSAVPTQHQIQENMLRRKTPSGTLPAAYDAAPMEWAARPAKQILLPYQAQAVAQMAEQSEVSRQAYNEHCVQPAGTIPLQGTDMGSRGSAFPNGMALPHNGNMQINGNLEPYFRQILQQQQHPMLPQGQMPEQTWMAAPPHGFQAMYNPITPPTASCDEVNGYLMGNAYNNMPPNRQWPTQYTGWGGQQITPSLLPQAVNNMSLNTIYRPPPQEFAYGNIWTPQNDMSVSSNQSTNPFAGNSQPNIPELRHAKTEPITTGQPHNRIPEAPTKEKVVVWAHKAYLDLLAAMQALRQAAAAENGTSSTKSGLYPRPPRISGLQPSGGAQAQTSLSRPHYISQGSSYDHTDRRKRQRPGVDLGAGYDRPAPSQVPNQNGYVYPPTDSLANTQQQRNPAVDCYSATPPLHRLSSGVTGSSSLLNGHEQVNGKAVVTAKHLHACTVATTALNILEPMCSDPEAIWLDGMLLAGCLAFVRPPELINTELS